MKVISIRKGIKVSRSQFRSSNPHPFRGNKPGLHIFILVVLCQLQFKKQSQEAVASTLCFLQHSRRAARTWYDGRKCLKQSQSGQAKHESHSIQSALLKPRSWSNSCGISFWHWLPSVGHSPPDSQPCHQSPPQAPQKLLPGQRNPLHNWFLVTFTITFQNSFFRFL